MPRNNPYYSSCDLKLNEYQYEIEHTSGEQNVWTDMFSTWAGQELTTARTASMKRWSHEQTSKLRPLVDLEWPTISHIAAAQSGKVAPLSHTLDDRGVYVDSFKRPWIPSTAEELLQRIMIVAHCGSQGRRGVNAMIQELEGFFDISNVQVKARAFCASCLLCCHVKGGNIIPRPYGELYRSSDRNEALHMDYLYVGKYDDTSDYILVLKDDYSHFCELIPCKTASALIGRSSLLGTNNPHPPPPTPGKLANRASVGVLYDPTDDVTTPKRGKCESSGSANQKRRWAPRIEFRPRFASSSTMRIK
ncbi:unnamed protein product [Phytophthora lilii]|uniref:Unnamed protein product n=1 Tax=Phytophthora lilii TaxID=2077276 RepID=A0A9W6U065_9STRA|nr:unnamed protein product [Phytophthora lilii]